MSKIHYSIKFPFQLGNADFKYVYQLRSYLSHLTRFVKRTKPVASVSARGQYRAFDLRQTDTLRISVLCSVWPFARTMMRVKQFRILNFRKKNLNVKVAILQPLLKFFDVKTDVSGNLMRDFLPVCNWADLQIVQVLNYDKKEIRLLGLVQ